MSTLLHRTTEQGKQQYKKHEKANQTSHKKQNQAHKT